MRQKRVAAIHDISCFGKCSLTVALPIISAAGVETAVIPTAVLSTHTGGFTGYTVRDLTEDILPIANHWKKEGITVDAVYSGYLCSKEQISLVEQAAKLISDRNTLLIVDPVMADNGKLYSGFSADYPSAMLELCKKADIITPNITEATMMLGMDYKEGPYTEDYILDIVKKLYHETKADVVLTGVYYDNEHVGAVTMEKSGLATVSSNRVPVSYHGTGDIFTSTLTAALMNGKSLEQSAQIAADFTAGCIERTFENHKDMRYGVNFEAEIPNLIKYLEK